MKELYGQLLPEVGTDLSLGARSRKRLRACMVTGRLRYGTMRELYGHQAPRVGIVKEFL